LQVIELMDGGSLDAVYRANIAASASWLPPLAQVRRGQ
jgi:hypothetical protein